MKNILFIGFILTLSGCAYQSNIIRRGNNNNIYLAQDTLNLLNGTTVLTNQVDLNFLNRIDGNSDHGSFNIFIATDSLYLEARSQFLSKDSISIIGQILSNFKQDTLHFTLKYRKRVDQIILNKMRHNSYSFQFKRYFDKRLISGEKDSTATFYLRKTQNFIIQDNILELLTGEGQMEKGKKFKFLIVNDPAKPPYYLTTIGLLDAAFLSEKDYSSYVSQCKNLQIINCKNGYDIDFTFNWYEFFVSCKCFNP